MLWQFRIMPELSSRERAYFPANYHNARAEFLRRAAAVNGEKHLESWPVPSRTDDDLFVDVLDLPASEQPDRVLLVTSGVHGSETYAGAAIQALLLEELLPRLDRRRTGVILVHALNPWGFKHHRRTTENFVNLNRNCSVTGEIYARRDPRVAEVNNRILERGPVKSLRSRVFTEYARPGEPLRVDGLSLDDIIKLTAPGQFQAPKDLEYGGDQAEPQMVRLIELMRARLPRYRDVLHFDLHTGLGHRGRLHMLVDDYDREMHPELMRELFAPEADADIYEFTPNEADGFYEVFGATNALLPALKSPHQRIGVVTVEFGTLGHSADAQLEQFNSALLEHQGALYGYETPELKQTIERESLHRSYPEADDWRAQVLGASRGLFTRVLTRAGALS